MHNNEKLCNLAPENDFEGVRRFLSKLTVEQFSAMNLELFAKLYFQLLDHRELLCLVNVSTINKFILRYGLEIKLLYALPGDMLKKLNMKNVHFCRRKTVTDFDYRTTTTSVRLEHCFGIEGFLRFLTKDLSEISITNEDYPTFTPYSPWSSRNEVPFNTRDYLEASWEGGCTYLMRFSDSQIQQLLIDSLSTPEMRKYFTDKILSTIRGVDPDRFSSLRESLGFAPHVDTTIPKSQVVKAFQTLKINRDANKKTAKKAYLKLARQYHPDKGGSHKKFTEINEAWQILERCFDS